MNTSRKEHQEHLETLYSKNQLIPRIKEEFLTDETFPFTEYMISKGIPVDFGISLLVQMALHKRTDLKTLVGLLRHHLDSGQETVDMIIKATEADLVDYSIELSEFIVKFTISDDVQEDLDRFQFPLPMVINPQKVKNNCETGYLLGKGSIILKNNHHEDDVCLDHINRINRTKFTINQDTALMIKNRWRNLDKAKNGESRNDFIKRCKAFDKYDRTAHDVIGLLVREGNEFYLTHKVDKRGRTYCQGYHVNYQGNPWNKAVIELSNKEMIV